MTADLPKDKTQVVVKSLIDLNYSATKIADILGISRASVYRYSDQATPDELIQFETEIKATLRAKQYEVLASLLMNIEDVASASKMNELASAYSAISKSINPTQTSQDSMKNSPMLVDFIDYERKKFDI